MSNFSFNLLLLCAAVTAVHKARAVCPAGTIQGLSPSDCFILQPTASSWLTAEESCVRAGGHLASSCPASKYWLGGNYNLQETGRWTWADGQRFSFSNWANGKFLLRGITGFGPNVAGRWNYFGLYGYLEW
ncbi:Nattectin [Aphelenchoides avenae]|nr:Nattectin [Aphelenchus avenae]